MNFQWFAHPFFALDDAHQIEVSVSGTAQLPADSGFAQSGQILRPARRYDGKDDGAFALLPLTPDQPLQVHLSHSQLHRGIHFSTTFVPSECPLWVNGFTFSIEPYQILQLAPGESRSWALTYQFG